MLIIETCKKTYISSVIKNGLPLLLDTPPLDIFPFDTPLLKCMPCIYHLVYLKKDQAKVQVLLNFNSKINTITPVYIARLGLKICPTNARAQKIDGSIFAMFKMVLTYFQLKDKLGRA